MKRKSASLSRGSRRAAARAVGKRAAAAENAAGARRAAGDPYGDIFREVPDVVYALDPGGRFIFVSESVRRLGYAPGRLLGRHFSAILHPDDVPLVSRRTVLRRYRGKITGDAASPKLFDERRTGSRITRNLVVRLRRKGRSAGKPRECHAELHSCGRWAERGGGGKSRFAGSVGIIRDISARVRAEEALRSSEVRFRRLFEAMRDGILILDAATGRILDANPCVLAMLGCAREKLIGRGLPRIRALRWIARSRRAFRDLKSGKHVRHGSASLETGGGRRMEVEFVSNVYRVDHGEVIQCTIRDVTERKAAEEDLKKYKERLEEMVRERTAALHESEERYRTLVERIPAITYIAAPDERSTTLYVSPQVGGVLGFSREDFRKDQDLWRKRIHPDDWEKVAAALELSQATGRAFMAEYRMRSRAGKIVWIHDEGIFVRDAGGKPMFLQGVMTDVTVRRRAEEDLADYQSRLKRMVEEQTANLKVANEQLQREIEARKRTQNKLTEYSLHLGDMVEERTKALRETQEKLLRQEKLALLGRLAGSVSHELRTPLGAIMNSVYYLKMLLKEPDERVKEMLEILEKEVAASEKIIKSLLYFARPRAPVWKQTDLARVIDDSLNRLIVPENVAVEKRLDSGGLPVTGDPDQLAQVFGNIIVNALQAMPEGGRLTIYSPPAGDPRWTSIAVEDTGVGITPENLEKCFEPLFTTKVKGIGFGLVISRSIVEGHGGTIEVRSEAGKGSVFTVRLPRSEGLPDAFSPAPSERNARGPRGGDEAGAADGEERRER